MAAMANCKQLVSHPLRDDSIVLLNELLESHPLPEREESATIEQFQQLLGSHPLADSEESLEDSEFADADEDWGPCEAGILLAQALATAEGEMRLEDFLALCKQALRITGACHTCAGNPGLQQ